MKTKNYIILIQQILLLIVSCKTIQYIPVETIKKETEYVNLIRVDSIYMKDSIYIRAINDTVFIDKYQYIYRNIYLSDTTYISKVDSIPYPVEVVKDKIVYQTKWYSKIMIYGFWIILAGLFVTRIWKQIKNSVISFI